jgi:hypothetical protein
VRTAVVLIILFTLVGGAAHAQNPSLGEKFRDSVMVADRKIPLLDGEWTVVAVGSKKSTRGNDIERVYLAQMAGNRLARWVNISTNEEWFPAGWSRDKEICDRKDVHAGYSDTAHNPKDTECWVLNHLGQTLGKDPSQASIDFYRWSDALGRPNTALALVYFFAKRGDFLRVEYSFNPVLAGFRDTGGAGWRGNPWHVDVASKDEKKLAYLRELKATGEALFEKLKGVLR